MTGEETPTLSFVIPCFNEEENVVQIVDAVVAEARKLGLTYEVVVVDNASTDDTAALAKSKCAEDPCVRLIVNNANYGQMRSPVHAIYQTRGRAVVGVAADFQDPPDLIPVFVERWRAGAMIVLGVRASENTSLTLKGLRALGYGFLSRFGDYSVIPGATGFGLYDRRVVDALSHWRDPEPFFRGMLVESGFPVETVPYHRPPRAGGETKNNLATLLGFFLSGLSGSSRRLLRAPLVFSLFVFAVAGVLLLAALVCAALGAPFWIPLLTGGFAFYAAINFLILGLIGDQVRLMSQIVRNQPLVVEKERINF